MSWVLLAVLGAFFGSIKNILVKKVSGPLDLYTVALFTNIALSTMLWIGVLLSGDFSVETPFWKLMLYMIPIEIVITLMFFKVFQDAALSSSFPFVAFMPFFVAIGSYFILDETLSYILIAGVSLITFGAFLLHRVNTKDPHFVLHGALYMFIITAFWGYIIPTGKVAVTYSSPQLFPALYFTITTIVFLPIYLLKRKTPLKKIPPTTWTFVGVGVVFGISQLLMWIAYSIGPTAGVAAVTLLSVLFTVILGGSFFKEKDVFHKTLATILMLGGAAVIILIH